MEGYAPITYVDMAEGFRAGVAVSLGLRARGFANFCTLCPRDPECHPSMGSVHSKELCDLPDDQYWVPEHVAMILKLHKEN